MYLNAVKHEKCISDKHNNRNQKFNIVAAEMVNMNLCILNLQNKLT